MASDATKVGSAYIEIRAQIKQLSKDLAAAEAAAKDGAGKIQKAIDKSLDFEKMKVQAVGAAAGVYAAMRVVGQAIESAKIGSTLEKQSAAFSNLSDAAGTSSKNMIASLKAASQGLVVESDLMAAAGKAMLMSIPADKIGELMKIAAATSKMTGQSITEAFNDITMGVARQSRMILDNLGIIVNVDDANRKYAKALGTTADALDDAQKRQAFMNAVLESGADMIKRLGSSSGSLDGVNKLIAAQSDLWAEVNKTVATFLDKELSGYATALKGIADILKGMRESAKDTSKAAAWQEIEMLKSLEAKGMAQPGTSAAKESAYNEKYLKPQMNLKPSEEKKLSGSFTTPAWSSASWREREGNFAANTEEQNKAILKGIEDERKAREKAAEDALKIRESFVQDYNKATLSEAQFAISEIDRQRGEYEKAGVDRVKIEEWYADEIIKIDNKVWEDHQKIIDETLKLQVEAAKEAAKEYEEAWIREAEGRNRGLMDKVKEIESANKRMVDLTEETARAMQSNFSDLFFDAMTGKLKTFEDYAKAVFDSIARMASDLAAQQLTRGLFGPEMKGGGWLSSLGSMIGIGSGQSVGQVGGAMTASQQAAANLPINTMAGPYHSGGTVGVSGGPMRSIPASYFASAPRLHQGLAADEYPAILQKGEQVIPKGGGKSAPIVHMHFYSQNGKYDRESVSQAQSGLYASLSRANRRNS
jgi:hypothetical protein